MDSAHQLILYVAKEATSLGFAEYFESLRHADVSGVGISTSIGSPKDLLRAILGMRSLDYGDRRGP